MRGFILSFRGLRETAGWSFLRRKGGIFLLCCWRGCKHLPPRAAGLDASRNGLASGGALGLVCRGLIVLCNGEPDKMLRTTNSLGGRVSCRAGPTKRGCGDARGGWCKPPAQKAKQNFLHFLRRKGKRNFQKPAVNSLCIMSEA